MGPSRSVYFDPEELDPEDDEDILDPFDEPDTMGTDDDGD